MIDFLGNFFDKIRGYEKCVFCFVDNFNFLINRRSSKEWDLVLV